VDSSALGAILTCLRRLKEAGGDLKICGLSKSVRIIFELVRFHKIMDIYGTQEEAVNAFQR
jgi:anti-sigma B factor antagonist